MHYSICDYFLDIIQNAIEAGASLIEADMHEKYPGLHIRVRDNGKGMTPEEKEKVLDPFYTDGEKHRRRRVGLGLPFLAQCLELTGGMLSVDSEKNRGTEVVCNFRLQNVDTPPVGNVPETLFSALTFGSDYDLTVNRTRSGADRNCSYTVNKRELEEILGGFDYVESLSLLRDFLFSQEGN